MLKLVTTCLLIHTVQIIPVSNQLGGSYQFHMHQQIPPTIFLSGYTEADSLSETYFSKQTFKNNDFVTKLSSNYILHPETVQVTFVCEATYPVKWKFPLLNQLPEQAYDYIDAKENRFSEFKKDSQTVQNARFENKISIDLHDLNFLSLNLICKSVNSEVNLVSSVLVFLQGKDILEHERQTVQVFYSIKSSSTLLIPCRPNSPDVKLNLARRTNPSVITPVSENDSWHSITTFESSDVDYDPKIGFKLKNRLGKATFLAGIYVCRIERPINLGEQALSTEDGFVYFNVTTVDDLRGTLDNDMTFISKNYTNAGASVFIKPDDRTSEVHCCSGIKDKPPRLFASYCESRLTCKLLAYDQKINQRENSDQLTIEVDASNKEMECATYALHQTLGMVTCKGDNVDFADIFVHLFHPLANGAVFNRSKRVGKKMMERSYIGNTTMAFYSLMEYKTPGNATTQEKIAVFVTKFSRRRSTSKRRPLVYFPSNFAKNSNNARLYYKLNPPIYEQIKEYDRDAYYEGEPLLFFCVGVNYFYAQGDQMILNWKNGTKSLLPEPAQNSRLGDSEKLVYLSGNANMFGGIGNRAETVFRDPVIAAQNMSFVECLMPLVESDQWDKLQKPLQVLPSVAPRFKNPEEETVYFYKGQEGQSVSCSVVEAKPFPSVKVLWDGKRLGLGEKLERLKEKTNIYNLHDNPDLPYGTKSLNATGVLIDININFKDKIEHAHHSTIQCIAKNVNKTVTRTIRIVVLEKTSSMLPATVSLSIAALFLVIFGALWIGRKRNWNGRYCVC